MKRTTIKDIAAIAGVNISTVSRALNNHPDIGVALRNRIKELAIEMNYHPNMTAVQLRKQKSNVIGLIIPEANMFFFPSVIKGISEVIQKSGYKLLVLQSNDDYQQEIENVKICYENSVDGLLMTLSQQTDKLDHLQELKEAGIPIVLLDKVLDNNDFDEVIINDAKATQMCVEYLVNTGCRRILGLFGNKTLTITSKRLDGFNELIATKKELNIATECYFLGNTFVAWECVERIYPKFKPDGIFAMSDELIAGVIPALKRLKVKIPYECSVIGISDGYLPKILDPEVSYLHHDGLNLGRMAAHHIIQKLTQKETNSPHMTLMLSTQLVINESTKKINDRK
ncbi:MAG: LacI family DNA-binding transcriptional regulator [Saprospiraceae bacterium]|nr:LacI family DNA-binding transcriptional regulator [Saprospiraceae bacterium]